MNIVIKEKLYNYFVRKNGRVWYEYERYVREHMEEHKAHRFRHLIILLKLNWFYRVKKGNTPYLYWDVPLDPNENNQNHFVQQSANAKCTIGDISESRKYPCALPVHLAKQFGKYDYIVINLFDVLLYLGLNEKSIFFEIIGKKLGIKNFAAIRGKTEEELANSNRMKYGVSSFSLFDIYDAMKKYINIDVSVCVECELRLLEQLTRINPYMKSIYDMISYNNGNIILVGDTVYSSDDIEKILNINGIHVYKDILVSNECKKGETKEDFFKNLNNSLETTNILLIDFDKDNIDCAEKCGWDIWKYQNAVEIDDTFKIDGMTKIIKDIYMSINSQHMYCGNFAHSITYEIGYSYYGLLMAGAIPWILEETNKYEIDRLFIVEESNDVIQRCFQVFEERMDIDAAPLYITEELAVKVLSITDSTFIYSYFIMKYINYEKDIAFYIDKMGLSEMSGMLENYGLKLSDKIYRGSVLYGTFMEFIEDNLETIQKIYKKDLSGLSLYLKSLNLRQQKIGILDVVGNGYIALALDRILNDSLHAECTLIEFSLISGKEYDFNNEMQKVYINLERMTYSETSNLRTVFFENRTRNILGNSSPVFKEIRAENEESSDFSFIYGDVYPWKYNSISLCHQGIIDFVTEFYWVSYKNQICEYVMPEDVVKVLEKLYSNLQHIKKYISVIRG